MLTTNHIKRIAGILIFLSSCSILYSKQYIIINNSSMTVFVDLSSDELGSSYNGSEMVDGKKSITITNPTYPVRLIKFSTGGKNRMVAFANPTNCENQTFEIKDDATNLTVSNYCN